MSKQKQDVIDVDMVDLGGYGFFGGYGGSDDEDEGIPSLADEPMMEWWKL